MRSSTYTSVLEIDKENQLPDGVVGTAKPMAHSTPGKRGKKGTNNQYFDVGRVGRKTGITLQDTGIRDEHGLEPVSGIFSSPVFEDDIPEAILEDVDENSSDDSPRINTAQRSLGAPKFPPVQNSTPRGTNIGPSQRMSTARSATRPHVSDDELSPAQSRTQPPPKRQLDFTGKVNETRRSNAFLDPQSPFRPRKKLRRSVGPIHVDRPASEDPDDVKVSKSPDATQVFGIGEDGEAAEQSIEIAEPYAGSPLFMEDGQSEINMGEETGAGVEELQTIDPQTIHSRHSLGRAESPSGSQLNLQAQRTPPTAVMVPPPSSRKRDRDGLQNAHADVDVSISMRQAEQGIQPPRRKRSRPSNGDQIVPGPSDNEETDEHFPIAREDEDTGQSPGDSAAGQDEAQPEPETQDTRPEGQKRGRKKGKQNRPGMPTERDPNRAIQTSGSPSPGDGDPTSSRVRRAGVSNVNLRASTPFEDAEHRTSQRGRVLIKPLKYWENETVIWNKGSIEGIVRADPVVNPETRGRKKRGRKRGARLDGIQEESDTESVMPDDWEEAQGVISGNVARWNPQSNAGDPNDPVTEDLAFAASSIVMRDVAGSDFKFAKIMTIPFFGAGIVELPPGGFKRSKNCKNMQMLFFVHEGKVVVEVGVTALEVNQFTLTKGGCWSVPRGNNYAITNESRTKWAKVFFAQGCDTSESELQP